MRTYTFNFTNGSSKTYNAEQDSLHPGGAVVLSKETATKDLVLSTGKKIEIVAVISLANLEDYTIVENG